MDERTRARRLAADDVATAKYMLLSAWHRAGQVEQALKTGELPSLEPVRERVLEARDLLDRAAHRLGHPVEYPREVA